MMLNVQWSDGTPVYITGQSRGMRALVRAFLDACVGGSARAQNRDNSQTIVPIVVIGNYTMLCNA